MLAGTTAIPLKTVNLEGQHIVLVPVHPDLDSSELFLASSGTPEKEGVWKYMFGGPYPDETLFKAHLQNLHNDAGMVAYTVTDKASGEKIGNVAYLNIVPQMRRIEIGSIWYTPKYQRTYANTEASYLLLRHAFEDLKYRRVEWKCDNQNERSKAAALRLGFTFEGVFRQHMIIKGQNRDTAWFSITDSEWESSVKEKLEGKLSNA